MECYRTWRRCTDRLTKPQRTLDLAGMKTPGPSRSPTTDYQSFGSASSAQGLRTYAAPGSTERHETDDATPGISQRMGTGGLRVAQAQSIEEDVSEHQRQMQIDAHAFPKRRKVVSEKFVFQPSTLDKLIIGIWEQVTNTPWNTCLVHYPDCIHELLGTRVYRFES
jgi:hypothetical protein